MEKEGKQIFAATSAHKHGTLEIALPRVQSSRQRSVAM
jgi:hypothetical protein